MDRAYACQPFLVAERIFPLTIGIGTGYGAPCSEAMSLGRNLRTLREAAELTQEVLAERADVSQSDISKWERGRVVPELPSAVRVAKVLKVSLDQILVGFDPEYDAITADLSRHAPLVDSEQQPEKAEHVRTSGLPMAEIERRNSVRSSQVRSRHVHRPVSTTADTSFEDQFAGQLARIDELARTLDRSLINLHAISEAVTTRAARAVTAPPDEQHTVAKITAPRSRSVRQLGDRKVAGKPRHRK
jgi:transcriptional regulator with XRE-family HTH domain